jgi:hypothetical protein
MDARIGRDFMGQPVNLAQAAARRAVPFSAQNLPGVNEALGLGGAETAPGLAASYFGARSFPEAKMPELQNDLANLEYGKKWEDLKPSEQTYLKARYPQLGELKAQERIDNPASELARVRAIREENRSAGEIESKLSGQVKQAFKASNTKVTGIDRTIGDQYRLSDDQYRLYKERAANYINEFVFTLMNHPAWLTLSGEQKRVALENLMSSAKERARREIIYEAEVLAR